MKERVVKVETCLLDAKMKNVKYVVLVLLFLFLFEIEVKADEGHHWKLDELPTGSYDELKECTYSFDGSMKEDSDDLAYVEITSENKARQSVGPGVAGEILNWNKSSNSDYWSGKVSFEAKKWYEDNNSCLPIFLKLHREVYLSSWTEFLSIYNRLSSPDLDIYYIVDGAYEKSHSYTCSYNIKTDDIEGNLDISYTDNWLPVKSSGKVKNVKVSNDALENAIYDWNIKFNASTRINEYLKKDYCPVVYLCSYNFYSRSSYALFNDSSFLEIYNFENKQCIRTICSSGDKCDPDKNKSDLKNGQCATVDTYLNISDKTDLSVASLAKSYGECVAEKKCTQNEKIQYLNKYNSKVSELKLYCENFISNKDYVESDPGCMKRCIELEDTLYELEKENGIIKANDSDCPISASIISFAYNILKWSKYIAPVLVIIISVLEFIKAIASQNEDDMKKAQGKFVKRLIASVLLFLVPLVINFMLKTFGLYSSECDITSLFG